jgi:UDP-N-acetylmuramate dehydrogenase
MSGIQENVTLKPFNTFHLDVKTRYMADLKNISQIRDFLQSSYARVMPRFILGGGSNVLFAADYNGIIIRPLMKGIEKVSETGDSVLVRAGAGEEWDSFVEWCVSRDLGGIENLSLIPGTVGASPVQNIGAYGVEVKDVIYSVEAVKWDDGEMINLTGSDCRFEYRDSVFKHAFHDKVIIAFVTFKLSKKHDLKIHYAGLERELERYPETSIRTIREAVISIRRNKLPDPRETGNAGSFFKNPLVPAEQAFTLLRTFPDMPVYPDDPGVIKLSAAWLIDQCGWKGKRVGNTGTHEKQPLILVNYGNATGIEILHLARKIQKSVLDHFAVKLDMEVSLVKGT